MNIVLRHSLASEMQTCRHLYADGDLSEHVIKLLLHDAEIAELARRFGWERYPAGRVVFLQGDYGSDFRVIRQGEARVTVATAAGKRQDRVLEEGSFFGELVLMGDSTRHASVRADTEMETLTIKEDVFRNLLESLPRIATRIAQARSYYVDRGPPLTRDAPGDA